MEGVLDLHNEAVSEKTPQICVLRVNNLLTTVSVDDGVLSLLVDALSLLVNDGVFSLL